MPFNDDDDRFDEPDELIFLELAKTRLRVYEDELQRLNAQGTPSLRIPLADIDSIELRGAFDPICLIFIGCGVALSAIAYFVSEWVVLTVILYLAAAVLGVIALFGVIVRNFIVRSVDGETRIQCDDAPDEAEGFVVSLRQMLRTRKNLRPRRPSDHSEPETGFRS